MLSSDNSPSLSSFYTAPGSETVQPKFFDEFAAIMGPFAMRQEPIYVTGDFNVRLDRIQMTLTQIN